MKRSRLRVGLLGASGRMGRHLQELVLGDPVYQVDFQLVYLSSGPNDPRFRLIEADRPDVLIDFSAPQATLAIAPLCAKLKIPLLVCTTGFAPAELRKLDSTLSKKVAWCLAPNTSLGVYALTQALRAALPFLSPDYSIEIVEAHHVYKKDAPSGTAKLLAQVIEESRPEAEAPVPMHSLRGGTEVGEHRVVIMGPDERLEFTHRASNRTLFAHGALKLARALAQKSARAKAYEIADLFKR